MIFYDLSHFLRFLCKTRRKNDHVLHKNTDEKMIICYKKITTVKTIISHKK